MLVVAVSFVHSVFRLPVVGETLPFNVKIRDFFSFLPNFSI